MSAATRWIMFYVLLILALVGWGGAKLFPAQASAFRAVALERLDGLLGLELGLANPPAPAPVKLAQAPAAKSAPLPLPAATTASAPVPKQAGTAPFPPDDYTPPGATVTAPPSAAPAPAPASATPGGPVAANTDPAAPPPVPAVRAPEPPVAAPAMPQGYAPPPPPPAPRANAGRDADMAPALRAAWAEARRAYWSHDLPSAREKYLALVKENTTEPDIAGELGNVYFTEGRYPEAAAQYFEAGMRMARSSNPGSAGGVIGILYRLDPAQADTLRQAMIEAERNLSQAR